MSCPRQRVLQLSPSRENKREGLLPDCRFSVKESESEDDLKLNALVAHTAAYFLNYCTWYESDDRAQLLKAGCASDRMYGGVVYFR